MRTKSFRLEATYPGIFLLQGWLGGIFAGYISLVCVCLLNETMDPLAAVLTLPFYVISWSILAVIKATILWATYRLTGIQLNAAPRTVVSSIGVGLLAVFTARLLHISEANDFAAWVGTLVLASLPTPLLVGSNVKPWELCTFGSMAADTPEGRVGSKSVLATLGTLPLRFLSLVAVGTWIVSVACPHGIDRNNINHGIVFSFSLVYFIFSAYITFRSPRKDILFLFGLVVNLPLAFSIVLACLNLTYLKFTRDTVVLISGICAIFIAAWVLFFVARLSVRSHPIPIDDLSKTLLRAYSERGHECLGSRFVAWHTYQGARS